VDDLPALEAAINESLAEPGLGHDGRRRLITGLLTFDDRQSSARVVAQLVDLLDAAGTPQPVATRTGPTHDQQGRLT
jgi:hypothetical protein